MTFREDTIELLTNAGLRVVRRGGVDPLLPPFVEVAFGGYDYPEGRRAPLMTVEVNVFGAWALGEDADKEVVQQVDVVLSAADAISYRGLVTTVSGAEPASLNVDGTPNFAMSTVTIREL